jgi:hypothetical protein
VTLRKLSRTWHGLSERLSALLVLSTASFRVTFTKYAISTEFDTYPPMECSNYGSEASQRNLIGMPAGKFLPNTTHCCPNEPRSDTPVAIVLGLIATKAQDSRHEMSTITITEIFPSCQRAVRSTNGTRGNCVPHASTSYLYCDFCKSLSQTLPEIE